ncbi:MAG: SMC-Scp complex subunit ScpB [Candidatus Aenigmarchaeota archaeon]|nr:SMC-Scp complex subunit ScpB [Candidatus Aenigmarchaeota archaeon]
MQDNPKIRNLDRYCALVEAILFAAPKPLSPAEIARISRINPGHMPQILKMLEIRYQKSDRGITLSRLGQTYKLSVKHDFTGRVAGLTKSELSRGLLRVLSLIAYHQPVSQSDIVKIIGNRTYEYVKELEKLGFVKGERKGKSK